MSTQPYYADDLVTLYLGDCLEQTAWTTADVLVTDPPYGMGYVEARSTTRGNKHLPVIGDADTTVRDAALRLWDASRAALVFGTWRAPKPEGVRQVVIWDKGDSPGMGDLALPWGPSHEDIYAMGKSGWAGRRGPSVVRAKTLAISDPRRPNHPTPKPVALMERLIASTDGVIVDPFAGSGATLIAARNLGRRVIGVELQEPYCELIARRLQQQAFVFEGLDA